jgi:hypothetical protein
MAEKTALNITETWARAATVTSSHQRDYFVEAVREMQRQKEAGVTATYDSTKSHQAPE